MSEATQVAAKAKTTKKASKPKVPSEHPQYKVMVAAAIAALKERGGSSRQAILKYITANYKVGSNLPTINQHLKSALKNGVKAGTLKQSKGTGAAGSFRLGEKKVEKKPKKPAAKKAKKPAAKKAKSPKKAAKPKKPAASKSATAKKPAAKKPAAAKKSPKKATKPKKPAAAKKPKSPAKKAAKKPAAKKAAPKKK